MGLSLSLASDNGMTDQQSLSSNKSNSIMTSRLMDAIQREDTEEIVHILSAGGHLLNIPEDISVMGYTPLQMAIQYNKVNSILYLLSCEGINIHGKSLQFGRSVLMLASEFILHPLIRKQYFNTVSNYNNMNKEENKFDNLNYIRDNCIFNVDSGNDIDDTVDIIELLIQRGAKLSDKDTDRLWTALHYAAYANNTYAIETLLQHSHCLNESSTNINNNNNNSNQVNTMNITSPNNHHVDIHHNNTYNVMMNAVDEYGQTPLMIAILKENIEAVICLLNIMKKNNNSAHDAPTATNGNDDDDDDGSHAIEYQQDITIDFSIQDRDGYDALSLAHDNSLIKELILDAIEMQQQQQQDYLKKMNYDDNDNSSSC